MIDTVSVMKILFIKLSAIGDVVQTLQIEMCQRLYMTEGEPAAAIGSPAFLKMQRLLKEVFGDIADAVIAGQCVRRL